MLCCEYHSRCFYQVPSSPFLKMSYFTSSGKTPNHDNDMIYYEHTKRWYMLISRPLNKPASDVKILKIRRLIWSSSFHFESGPWRKHRDLFVLIECSCVAPTSCPCSLTGRNLLARSVPSPSQGGFHREGAGRVNWNRWIENSLFIKCETIHRFLSMGSQ